MSNIGEYAQWIESDASADNDIDESDLDLSQILYISGNIKKQVTIKSVIFQFAAWFSNISNP